MKKLTSTGYNKAHVKKKEDEAKQLILSRVNKTSNEEAFSDHTFDQYNEQQTILDMVSKVPFRKYINHSIAEYHPKFPKKIYDEMYRLTGLKPDPRFPHLRPNKFANLTLLVIYGSFPKGIIAFFHENNKADDTGVRLYKHFQLLNKLGEKRLLDIIENAWRIMKKGRYWDHFMRLYAEENKNYMQGTMWE